MTRMPYPPPVSGWASWLALLAGCAAGGVVLMLLVLAAGLL